MGFYANHRVTPPALVAPELDIANERPAVGHDPTSRHHPRHGDFPATLARHPEMRIALVLGLANCPSAAILRKFRHGDNHRTGLTVGKVGDKKKGSGVIRTEPKKGSDERKECQPPS
jgi:hypothetical protein